MSSTLVDSVPAEFAARYTLDAYMAETISAELNSAADTLSITARNNWGEPIETIAAEVEAMDSALRTVRGYLAGDAEATRELYRRAHESLLNEIAVESHSSAEASVMIALAHKLAARVTA